MKANNMLSAQLLPDVIAMVGEFIGTTMFIFIGLGGVQTAFYTMANDASTSEAGAGITNNEVIYAATSLGLSLLVTAWIFYRITGALFNPAITLALFLVGALSPLRAILLTVSQVCGGIAGAGLVAALFPDDGRHPSILTLGNGVSIGQGIVIEGLTTAILVFSVLMLAAEKHRATYIAPIGIGLVLFVCAMTAIPYTGAGLNPARALGPSVVWHSFPSYHWLYHVGEVAGSLVSVAIYMLLKFLDYSKVVSNQDSDNADNSPANVYIRLAQASAGLGFTKRQKEALIASGLIGQEELEKAEQGMRREAEAVMQAGDVPLIIDMIPPIASDARSTKGHVLPMDRDKGASSTTTLTAPAMVVSPTQLSTMAPERQDVGGVGEPGSFGWTAKAT